MKMRLLFFIILPLFTLVYLGCKSEPDKPPRPETTIENLKVAHAAAYHRAAYYAAAGKQAEQERLGNLAKMYRAIARSEQIHAAGHEEFLKQHSEATDTTKSSSLPLGTVRQALKMGISLEATETTGLYPAMQQAAATENWPEAAEQFTQFRQADLRHAELLTNAQDRRGVLSIATYCVCQHCGYIQVDQSEAVECPVCKHNLWERF